MTTDGNRSTSKSDHRVLDHLGLTSREYDTQIRRWIPAYEDMIANVVGLARGYVIDLGTGTGALGAQILASSQGTRVRLVDIDPAMLETAAARVSSFGDRVDVVQARFDEGLVPCDAVVASLALHHVGDVDAKRALYRRVHDVLRPGGVFAIGDATTYERGPEHDRAYGVWREWMAKHGIGDAEADGLFAQWSREDRYLPLRVELELLRDAGFAQPECFWRYGPMTVYGAYR
jgi:tRNA (cmo5U34)-methyltransferase